jgi:hypothetical protein
MPAPGGWFRCRVVKVGPADDGEIYISLTDTSGSFSVRWFTAVASQRKEMLDTGLAALTAMLDVDVNLASTDEYGVVNRMYVVARYPSSQ